VVSCCPFFRRVIENKAKGHTRKGLRIDSVRPSSPHIRRASQALLWREQSNYKFCRCTTRVIAVMVLLCSSILYDFASGQTQPIRRVLILNEVGVSYPLINLVDQGIRAALDNSGYRIEFYREYFDAVLFPDPADQQRFRKFYIRKYQNRRPDVIITVGSTPLQFILDTHQKYFPGISIVFCLPSGVPTRLALDPELTGVAGGETGFSSTIAAALRLKPDTKRVVVVGGQAPYDRQQQATVRDQLKAYADHLEISYFTEMDTPVLLQQLKQLPGYTIVLLTALGKDASGRTFTSTEAGPMVVNAANAPVFAASDRFFNHGEVGGDISSGFEQGRIAGTMALRLLKGDTPKNIPVVKRSNVYMFDWQALKRWGLKEYDLPPGSIVVNRRPTFWEAYKRYLIAACFVVFAQSLALLGLLWERAKRRKIQIQLKKSEDKFSKAFRRSPLSFTLINLRDYQFIEVNDTFERDTGWSRHELIGHTPLEINFWADTRQRAAFIERLRAEEAVQNMEILFCTKDGRVRTGLVSSELIDLNGEPHALTLIADITHRKLAEESLAQMGRRLIEAHEEERTWIARELHDDINQQVALLSIEMEGVDQNIRHLDTEMHAHLQQVRQRLADIGQDIHSLSHRLHSSNLEYLGISAAANSFCREFSEQQGVGIDFTSTGMPRPVPKEIALCLFRVLQEALQNAAKHSGARHFAVELCCLGEEILLSVRDRGLGFDPREAINCQGLGLISMRERLHLVRGRFSIMSEPGCGTTVEARVPFCSINSPCLVE